MRNCHLQRHRKLWYLVSFIFFSGQLQLRGECKMAPAQWSTKGRMLWEKIGVFTLSTYTYIYGCACAAQLTKFSIWCNVYGKYIHLTRFRKKNNQNIHEVNILWHVRKGDITLHADDESYFTSILDRLLEAINSQRDELGKSVNLRFISERNLSNIQKEN